MDKIKTFFTVNVPQFFKKIIKAAKSIFAANYESVIKPVAVLLAILIVTAFALVLTNLLTKGKAEGEQGYTSSQIEDENEQKGEDTNEE